MQKAFTILIFTLAAYTSVLSQNINSLKKVLLLAKDTKKIDCLNALSYAYILLEKKDSAKYFATAACEEAKMLNYIHGIAVSFSIKSQIAKHFDDDFILSETMGKESLHWYERTDNKEGIDTLYSYLIYTVFAQSRFDEALDFAEKEYAFAKQKGSQSGMFDALSWKFAIYRQSGNYEKSFLFAQQKYDLALKAKNKMWISSSLYSMAQLYELVEDYPAALNYFRRVIQMDDKDIQDERVISDNDIWFKMEFTEVFSHLNQFDSAWHYYNSFKPSKDKAQNFRVYWVSTGECFFLQKDYYHALENFQLGLAEHKRLNDQNEIMRTLLDIGKTHLALNNNSEALKYGREGLCIALKTKARQFARDGYQIFSTVYDRMHQADSANFYFRQYITMKDAVLDDQAKAKFAAYNYEQKIALMNKEKEISKQQLKIKQQQLQQDSLQKKILIAGIVILFLLAGVILRSIILKRRNERQRLEHELEIQKLESEKTKAELQQQASELEMQALRAQMNPHFIFNCLGSINRFILKNESESASDYLTKFSRLIRMVLHRSKESAIILEDELEMLRLYLDMERLRFKNNFDYTIIFKNEVDVSSIYIPPLLLQPFAENAIWHGLLQKEGDRHLSIVLSEENNMLQCTIIDNGIGREAAAAVKSKSAEKQKSMGLQITRERLALINGNSEPKTFLEIEDLFDEAGNAAGTRVTLKIRIREAFEEYV